jgi:hypothetical protein
MALTLEGLDRRVTALEKAAETEKNIVRAVSEIVSESEKRVRAQMSGMKEQMADMKADIGRLADRIGATERRFTDLLNERFDAILVAIDRRHNPPK